MSLGNADTGVIEYMTAGLNKRVFLNGEFSSYYKLKYGIESGFISANAYYTFNIPKHGAQLCYVAILLSERKFLHRFMEEDIWPMVKELAGGEKYTVSARDTAASRTGVMRNRTMFIYHNDVIFVTNPLIKRVVTERP